MLCIFTTGAVPPPHLGARPLARRTSARPPRNLWRLMKNSVRRETQNLCLYSYLFFPLLLNEGLKSLDCGGTFSSGAGKSSGLRTGPESSFRLCGFVFFFFSFYFQPPITTQPTPSSSSFYFQGLNQQTRGRKHWWC